MSEVPIAVEVIIWACCFMLIAYGLYVVVDALRVRIASQVRVRRRRRHLRSLRERGLLRRKDRDTDECQKNEPDIL